MHLKELADRTLGLVLAGGESSRMGMQKGLVPFDGVPMIERAIATLRSVFSTVALSCRTSGDYRALGVRCILDEFPGHGPMAGIHAALRQTDAEAVFVLPCDTPLVTRELILYILAHACQTAPAVASLDGRVHPLCGVYPRSCLVPLEDHLRQRKLKMTRFLESMRAEIIPVTPDLPFYTVGLLENFNSPTLITPR